MLDKIGRFFTRALNNTSYGVTLVVEKTMESSYGASKEEFLEWILKESENPEGFDKIKGHIENPENYIDLDNIRQSPEYAMQVLSSAILEARGELPLGAPIVSYQIAFQNKYQLNKQESSSEQKEKKQEYFDPKILNQNQQY